MAARFWVGGTGTWDATNTANWSATSGGAGGASVPGAADTVTIDASSGAGTITVNGNFTITSLTCGAMNMTLDFSANNNNITMTTFNGGGTGTRTVNMGNGTWTLTGAGTQNVFGVSSNLTLNAGDSNVVLSNTGNTAITLNLTTGATLNKLTFSRGASTGVNTIGLGNNPTTINTFISTGTAAHSFAFQQNRQFTVGNFLVGGSAGNAVTIRANGAIAATLVKSPLGIINTDYITGSGANPLNSSPANTWYIGTNSVAPGTGWVTTNYPAREMGTTGVG